MIWLKQIFLRSVWILCFKLSVWFLDNSGRKSKVEKKKTEQDKAGLPLLRHAASAGLDLWGAIAHCDGCAPLEAFGGLLMGRQYGIVAKAYVVSSAASDKLLTPASEPALVTSSGFPNAHTHTFCWFCVPGEHTCTSSSLDIWGKKW